MTYSLPMPGLGFGFPNVTGPAQPFINQGLRSAAAIGNVLGATAAFTVVFGAVDMELQRRSAEDYFRRNGHYPGDLPNNYVEANGQAGSNGQTPATASSSPQRPAATVYTPPFNATTYTAPQVQSYEQMQAQLESERLQREQVEVSDAVRVAHQYPLTLASISDRPASLEAMTLRSGESSWDATERVMASFVQEAMDFNGKDANRAQGLRMIAFERTLPDQFTRVPSRVVGTAAQLSQWIDPLRKDARGNYVQPLLSSWAFRVSGVDPNWARDAQISQFSTDGPVYRPMLPGDVGDSNAAAHLPDVRPSEPTSTNTAPAPSPTDPRNHIFVNEPPAVEVRPSTAHEPDPALQELVSQFFASAATEIEIPIETLDTSVDIPQEVSISLARQLLEELALVDVPGTNTNAATRALSLLSTLSADATAETMHFFQHEFMEQLKAKQPAAIVFAGVTAGEALEILKEAMELSPTGVISGLMAFTVAKFVYMGYSSREDIGAILSGLAKSPIKRSIFMRGVNDVLTYTREYIMDNGINLINLYSNKSKLEGLYQRFRDFLDSRFESGSD